MKMEYVNVIQGNYQTQAMTCRYYGDVCDISCPGLITDGDEVKECNGNGKCVLDDKDEDQYHCICNGSKFGGDDCSPVEDETPSVTPGKSMCSGHGLYNEYWLKISLNCRNDKCDCIIGYYGENCEQECDDEETCSGNGYCTKSGACICKDGYDGINCEEEEQSYGLLIFTLITANIVIAYLWYRSRVG